MHAAHSLTKYTRSTCKDLCYWVFYPFYCFPFTHTNSNWLYRTKFFGYHAAALISNVLVL